MKQLSVPEDFFDKTKISSRAQTSQKEGSSCLLNRVAEGDRDAVQDCIARYGNLIWAMAKKFTASNEDAEAVTEEIFLEIWRSAKRFEQTDFDELIFIKLIARQQLRKYAAGSHRSII